MKNFVYLYGNSSDIQDLSGKPAALDVAPYKRDFLRGSRTGGFLRALRFPPPSKLNKISLKIGSSEERFRLRDERKRAEKM
jgi:hypothetical protein